MSDRGGPGGPSERLRFKEFEFSRLPNGRCRARVGLGWTEGAPYVGEAEGVTSQAGELRCAAAASVHALGRAVGGDLEFELLGVKAVKAFDATVVIVSLSARKDGTASRLVGSFLTDAEPNRGAALAVLNATNRLLGNYFATR